MLTTYAGFEFLLFRDHFWLNEGWTVWLQRKIMSRMKKNPKFLDFDSIQGRKALSDTVADIAPENTTLVLNIGDGDPDNYYSKVSYEKVSFCLVGEKGSESCID